MWWRNSGLNKNPEMNFFALKSRLKLSSDTGSLFIALLNNCFRKKGGIRE